MENKKQKVKSNKTVYAVCVLVAVALVSAVALGFIFLGDAKGKTDILPTESVAVDSSEKTGFPLSFSGQIDTVALSDTSVYVLTDNEITSLSSRGSVLGDRILNFTDPMIKSGSAYAIAYDRQGSSYLLFGRKGVVKEGKTESEKQIITATVTDDGKYLIASRSTEATSELTYYSKSGEILFRWLCTNEHIISADISSNGNSLVCAALYSDEGKILTKVYYFDINSSDNNQEYTFNSTAAVDCFFTSSRNAVVVCSDKRIFVKCTKDDFEPIICEYDASILMRSTDEKGNTAVLCEKSDDVENYKLTLYSNTNQVIFELDVPSDINDIACFGKKVYLLTNEKIIKVSDFDKTEDIIITESSCDNIRVNSKGVYYFTNTTLYCN